jgi:hypothetical protein
MPVYGMMRGLGLLPHCALLDMLARSFCGAIRGK